MPSGTAVATDTARPADRRPGPTGATDTAVARSAAVTEEVSAIPTGASGGSCSSGTPGSTGAARTLTAATYTHLDVATGSAGTPVPANRAGGTVTADTPVTAGAAQPADTAGPAITGDTRMPERAGGTAGPADTAGPPGTASASHPAGTTVAACLAAATGAAPTPATRTAGSTHP
ncbi:hypothetical protein BST12_28730, partial [Mycobacterium angelicum]